jgi:hypothetical protein
MEGYYGSATQAQYYLMKSEEEPTESPKEMDNMVAALDAEEFKTYVKNPKTGVKDKLTANEITAVAMPYETELPGWLEPFIDYNSIIDDNIGGFPYESIGIQRMNKSVNYTNIVKL